MRARQLLKGVYAGRDINQILHADNVTFSVDREVYRCGLWPPAPAAGGMRPSELLDAANEVVPFDEPRRRADLARLARWRDAGGPGVSVMLLHGPGGQGKTRLAAHFARESRGWLCLHARQGSQKGRIKRTAHLAAEDFRGLLLVVDYSERWSTEDLATLVDDHLDTEVPVRMLFLSRPDGWLPEHELRRQGVSVASHELEPLADTPGDRRRVFADACAAFAARLGVRGDHWEPPRLDGDRFAEVLTVHMAALAAVHGEPLDEPHALSAFLLDREKDAWRQSLKAEGFGTGAGVMEKLVLVATLAGPMPVDAAAAVLARLGIGDADAAIRDHGFLYPGGDDTRVLWPLLPDRLGEDFVALLLPGDGVKGRPWATGAVAACAGTADAARQGLTVLIEVAARWRHCALTLLYPMLAADGELLLEVGGPAAMRLASHTHDEALPLFMTLIPAFPAYDLRFDGVQLALLARLVRSEWLTGQSRGVRAVAYSMYANRLIGTGRDEEVREYARLGMECLRAEWEEAPTEQVRDLLQTSMDFYAGTLFDSDKEAALALSAEAEAIRALGEPDPNDLDVLRWRARLLKQTGAREEAIELSAEVLRRYAERDAAAGAGPSSSRLRHAIVHTGELILLDRYREATVTAEDVVRLAPEMAGGPGAYLPLVADAVHLLTVLNFRIGNREGVELGLASLTEVLRAMAVLQPSADPNTIWRSLPGLREMIQDGHVLAVPTPEGVRLELPPPEHPPSSPGS